MDGFVHVQLSPAKYPWLFVFILIEPVAIALKSGATMIRWDRLSNRQRNNTGEAKKSESAQEHGWTRTWGLREKECVIFFVCGKKREDHGMAGGLTG
jgi:hypothetical protein